MTIITQIIGTETKIGTTTEAGIKITTGSVIKIKVEVAMTSRHGSKSNFIAGIRTMITSLIVVVPGTITNRKLSGK